MWPFKKKTKTIPVTTTSKDGEDLTPYEQSIFHQSKCPDCLSALYEGPCGGVSQNILCRNEECGVKFNMTNIFDHYLITRLRDKRYYATTTQ